MFKKEGEYSEGGETIIARGVKLEGDFNSQGSVVVEGEVAGSVTTSSDLRVGETAKISANVKAKNAIVAGEIDGNAKIDEKLELLATAKINGDLETKILSVTPGAIINGKVAMHGGQVAETVAGKPAKKESRKTEKAEDVEEEF